MIRAKMRVAESRSGDGQSLMDEFIARENIKRFEAQLESSTDESQWTEINALLEAERQRLREFRQAMIPPKPQA